MTECEYCGTKLRRKSFWKGKIVCSDCFTELNQKRKTNNFKKVKGILCPECKKNYLSRDAKRCVKCWRKFCQEIKNENRKTN